MATQGTNSNRAYAAAHFALELDHKSEVGLFRSIEGGGVRADVMTYQSGGVYDRWRQLGKPKFEDIKLQVGMAMSQPFYQWIAQFFDGQAVRKSGAIIAADFYYKERARRDFTEAMIKELTFPKLEGSDKSAAYMNISLSVEDVVFSKGKGGTLDTPKGFNTQKLWTACNFRLKIDQYPDACRRTSKIDSFTVKQNIIEYQGGGLHNAIKVPSQVDFPNLVFYIPEADAAQLIDHCEKRVRLGEVRPTTTLNGHIETYDNDGRNLFTLSYYGADILGITPDKSDASSEEIKQVKVEMYTERMEFEYAAMEVE